MSSLRQKLYFLDSIVQNIACDMECSLVISLGFVFLFFCLLSLLSVIQSSSEDST